MGSDFMTELEERLADIDRQLDILNTIPVPPLANPAATTAPGAGDDSGDGYGVGSVWLDTTADVAYVCLDDAVAAAVWKRVAPSFTPLATALTSTSWDGDAKGTGDNGIIDLSAVFGVPAGVAAVLVRMSQYDTVVGSWAALGPSSGNPFVLIARTIVANQFADAHGIIPCDSNGDIYATFSTTVGVTLVIYGYWL